MVKTDVLIIGAGLLGCFSARNLTRYELDVTVLEKEGDVCRGISKANTGIIYTGYDNHPGSDKIKLCVQANEQFDRLCRDLDVPFFRSGSIMVSYGPAGDAVLKKKYDNGIKGGIEGLRLISGAEAESSEPALAKGITSGLYSPHTGTLDPWELCIAAYENALHNGAVFRFNSNVISVARENGGFIVETENELYRADALVNAAGLSADRIRELTEKPDVRLFPTAADYIILDKGTGSIVNHIIFHEGENGKGLTLVPTVDGNLLIGPVNREADEDERAAADMRTSAEGLENLRKLCRTIVPGIDLSKQIRTFGALRPDPFYVYEENGKIKKTDKGIKDIRIMAEEGLFSLIGIKTPGLTVANEIGRLTADMAAGHIGKTSLNKSFDPRRKSIIRARNLTLDERAALIAADPDYGKVVCACMDVTLAEIKQAINNGASDIESVKRRTGILMGKCQGSRCRKIIMDLFYDYK